MTMPRRLKPTADERLQIFTSRSLPGTDQGSSRSVLGVARNVRAAVAAVAPAATVQTELNVIVGRVESGVDYGIAIDATINNPDGSSHVLGDDGISFGRDSEAHEQKSISVGYNSGVGTVGGVSFGALARVLNTDFSTSTQGGAFCYDAEVSDANYGLAIGNSTRVSEHGAFALGTDSGGTGAASHVANQGVIGTANHTVKVPGVLVTSASVTGHAGFNVPHGTAPTSPTDGDMWTTTAGMFVRINGTTKTVTLT